MYRGRNEFLITSDKDRVDIDALHGMPGQTYWAKGRSRNAVAKSVDNFLYFSLLKGGERIGFTRAFSDGVN